MRLSPCFLSAAFLATGVRAFYPFARDTHGLNVGQLDRRWASEDGRFTVTNTPTLELKKVRRDNKYKVITADTPSTPNSTALNQDGHDFLYFADVSLGSNSQKMWMLLDTGGMNTWIFGSNCTAKACDQHDRFSEKDTTSIEESGKEWNVGYGTGAVGGVLITDTLSIAGMSVRTTLGLASKASDDFLAYPMDGILGLAPSTGSQIGTNSFMDDVKKEKLLKSNIVGFSLSRVADGGKDGEVTFGRTDDSKYTDKIRYTKSQGQNGLWSIPLDGVSVNGKECDLSSNRSAIIDTGTSYLLVPPSDAKALHALIPGSSESGSNYVVPCNSTAEIQLTFSGHRYSIAPKDYIGSRSSGPNCASSIMGQKTFGDNDWLVGDVFLKNVYTVFDYDENRVGFAPRADGSKSGDSTNGTSNVTSSASASASATASATVTGPGTGMGTGSSTSPSPSRGTAGTPGSTISSPTPKNAANILLASVPSYYGAIFCCGLPLLLSLIWF